MVSVNPVFRVLKISSYISVVITLKTLCKSYSQTLQRSYFLVKVSIESYGVVLNLQILVTIFRTVCSKVIHPRSLWTIADEISCTVCENLVRSPPGWCPQSKVYRVVPVVTVSG